MKRLLLLSSLLFILGSALSAQVIKMEKVKINTKPVTLSVMSRPEAANEGPKNNNGSKLVRKKMTIESKNCQLLKKSSKK